MVHRANALTVLACIVIVAGCSGSSSTPSVGAASKLPAPSGTEMPSGTNGPASPSSAGVAPAAKPVSVFNLSDRGGTAFADGSVWMAGGDTLLRIDPDSGRSLATIFVGGISKFVFSGDGSIWISRAGATGSGQTPDGSTVRVDPQTNRVIGSVPFGVAFGFGSLWAMDADGRLLREDPSNGRTVGSVLIQGAVNWQPQIAIGFGSVWVGSGDMQTVVRVDPTTMRIVATIGPLDAADSLLSLGVGFDSVWAQANAASATGTGPGPGMLYRIDPASDRAIASMALGGQAPSSGYGATVVGIGDGSVWTGDSDSTISRVDPTTNSVVAVRTDSSSHEFIAAGFGSVWADDERFDGADWTP